MENKTAIIFGATGAIGRHLAATLSKKQPSWTILAASRSAESSKFDGMPNVKVVEGDPNNRQQVMELTKDVHIIYCCVGLARYERKHWAKHWPIIVDNLLAGSSQSNDQKFVFCDNLYAYVPGVGMSPKKGDLVEASDRSKPGVRAAVRRQLQARMDARPESIAVVGGSDFFGPLVTSNGFLGDTFTKAIAVDGKRPIAIGSADVVHDFCCAPDFAEALYVASVSDEAYGRFWICPHSIKGKTMSDIASDVAKWSGQNGTDLSRVTVYGKKSVYFLSPFIGFMKEMIEMLPLWTSDYSVDDSDFCETFGVSATPYEDAMRSYIRFYRGMEGSK